ncbi:MAG TPA: DUF3352 domain-containing protein, partial [Candidatus Limnocylindrales bacterium]|nr:DUF3352 domain-containing protein [Candidatus Limnocylindrales bacterium]
MTDPRATSGQVDETTIEDLPAAPGYRATPPLTPPVGPDGGPNLHDGPGAPAGAVAPRGRGFAIRWIVALLGIAIVAAGSFVIVSLAGGRPAQSGAIGYMPDSIATYAEVRLDLPGDQRQKVATFLHTGAFPGFADQANITPKIEDIYDRVVRLASHDQQTYTADIQPWFGGTMGIGQELTPLTAMGAAGSMPTASPPSTPLVVLTITDRSKALAYLTGHIDATHLQRSTYNGADYFTTSAGPNRLGAIAITDKVLVVGEEAAVKAAVDTGGNGAFASDADVKAALATVDRDDVLLTVVRLRAAFQSMTAAI